MNTSAYADGDVLYYNSAVTGGTTNVYPTSGFIITVAAVTKGGSVGGGTINIRVTVTQRITASTGISVAQTSSGSVITNSAPDQVVSLTGAGTTSISGTYPSFTITSNDAYVGTVTSVAALTLGTTGTDLSSTVANGTTTPVITLNVPTASATNRGALSAADWTTFNNKQPAGTYVTNLTGPITSVGNATSIASQTGTGTTFAMSASPTFTGTVGAADLTTTGNTILGNASTDTLNVGNNGLVKDASGNVMVGIGTAYGKFTVVNPTGISAFFSNSTYFDQYLKFTEGTGYTIEGNYGIYIKTNTVNNAYPIKFAIGSTEGARFDGNSYLLVGYTTSNGAYKLQVNSQIFATSSTIATSDGRYKENVSPIQNALDLVNKLNPVSFDWKKHPIHNFDTETTAVGFIAQEVQEALKGTAFVNSIVKKNECTLEDEIFDQETKTVTTEAVKEEFLGIAEGNMIAILTKALQELNAKFDAYVASHP